MRRSSLSIPARLLAWRPDAYAYIAARLTPTVSRNHVRLVAIGERESPRIMAVIRATLHRHRA